MKAKILLKAATLSAALVAAVAQAAPVLSEDFNSGFQSPNPSILSNDTSDNWNPTTNYYDVLPANGWSFTSGTYFATNGNGDGAILLNENGGSAATTVTGLTVGQNYTLTFNVFGDNRPTEAYSLDVTIGNSPTSSFAGTDQVAGFYNNSGGPVETISFTAEATSELLSFVQTSKTQASPIIDNVMISAVPEPETYAMLLAGLGLMGFMSRRKSEKKAA